MFLQIEAGQTQEKMVTRANNEALQTLSTIRAMYLVRTLQAGKRLLSHTNRDITCGHEQFASLSVSLIIPTLSLS